ncbi:armadillo-type protein [Immersiella caudata]|uniref:Nucleolar protein 9 n=1 Tax=Immersiella caudata TaxID=314043 RepID=A0AA39WB60_9PEZI|nr:armadillo-type protein [Immersiella caudata]
MEELFLLTLDELEEHLPYLVSDRYGSHALRALLITLSGRPLKQVGTRSLLQSKKKEYITVDGASGLSGEFASQVRAVPESFGIAVQKIITDSTAGLDATALRVLAKHPTGNPTLQLLLELEFEISAKAKKSAPKAKKKKKGEEEQEVEEQERGQEQAESLLEKLVPSAPASFSDEKSPAAEFVNSMMYDVVGSRLLETLITNCPGKIFKGLLATFFAPRIQSLLRNDIASYPALRVLLRLSKEDLADAVEKSLPHIPDFVQKGRFNVIKTFFERCHVRQATPQLNSLLQALTSALGNDHKHFIPKLCLDDKPPADGDKKEKSFQPAEVKSKSALLSHASQLVTALLGIPGSPSKAIQTSITSLSSAQLLKLATESAFSSAILVKAFSTSSQNPNFHKVLVASLLPHAHELATNQHGSLTINAIIAAPSKGDGISVPFHAKENMMSQLEHHERDLRETWVGRSVWKTWKGDLWSHRRHDWVRWAKETDPEAARVAATPKPRAKEEGREEKKANTKGKTFDVKEAKKIAAAAAAA